MLFIAEKQQKAILNFSLDSLIVANNIIIEHQKILNLFIWSKWFEICDWKMEHCQWSIKCKLWCGKFIYNTKVLTLQRPGRGGLHRPPLFLKTHISVTPNPFFMKFYDFSSNFIYFQMQKKFFSNFETGCRGNQFVDTW